MNKDQIIKALRDTAQSASNTVAGNFSGSVDLLADGLRHGGVPVPINHVGGTQWMQQMGLTVPVDAGMPKLAGEAIGLTVPALMGAKIANPQAIDYFKRIP